MVIAYLIPFHGDVSALVCADRESIGISPFEAVTVGFPRHGYDGQFYYVIAQNPFNPQAEHVDDICLRRARLFYPLMSWLFSGGDSQLLLWVMPLLNLIATMVTTWLGTKFALHHGRSRWWGLLLPIATDVYVPCLRNLTDPLSMTTVVGVIVSWNLRWPTWSLLAFGVASVLNREQNIAIVALIFLETVLERDRRRALAMVTAGAVWIGWMLLLYFLHGMLPVAPQNTAAPFAGIAHGWTHLGMGIFGSRNPIPSFLGMSVVSAEALVCLAILPLGFRTAGLLGLGATSLVIIGGTDLYEGTWHFVRQMNWVPLAVWLWAVESGRRWPAWLLLTGVFWPGIELFKWCLR